MVIKSIQIFKGIILLLIHCYSSEEGVHHHIICWVAQENVLRATVIFLTVVCNVRA